MRRELSCVVLTVALLLVSLSGVALATTITAKNVERLTYNTNRDFNPEWSPDDNKIVYTSDNGPWPSVQLYEILASGTDSSRSRLTFDGLLAEDGKYSPDGKQIAFDKYFGNLALMDSRGDSYGLEILMPGGWNWRAGPLPDWSPDGKKIVYSIAINYPPERQEIYMLDLETRTEKKLTLEGDFDEFRPVWSPDGEKIAFTRANYGGKNDIWVMDSNGDNKYPVTSTSDIDETAFSWSPDSTMIVFESYEYGNADIFVMGLDGTNKIRLTTDSSNEGEPVWSHSTNKIAFTSDRFGNPDIWVMDLIINEEPDVSQAYPSKDSLWPPNNKYVDITIQGVTDPDEDEVTIEITAITSDEPTTAGGKNMAPDADPACIGTDTAKIRAERNGNGRVYEITFVATDCAGAQSVGTVKICVSHDQGKGSVCIDDGQLYDATGIN